VSILKFAKDLLRPQVKEIKNYSSSRLSQWSLQIKTQRVWLGGSGLHRRPL